MPATPPPPPPQVSGDRRKIGGWEAESLSSTFLVDAHRALRKRSLRSAGLHSIPPCTDHLRQALAFKTRGWGGGGFHMCLDLVTRGPHVREANNNR